MYWFILVHAGTYCYILTGECVNWYILVYTVTYKYIPVHPSSYKDIPACIRTYWYIPVHTSSYPYTPVHTGHTWVQKRCKRNTIRMHSHCTARVQTPNTGYATMEMFMYIIPMFMFLPVYLALDVGSTAPVPLRPRLLP